jgi:hypothetical protein
MRRSKLRLGLPALAGSVALACLAVSATAQVGFDEPTAPAGSFASADGSITVVRPEGAGWECLQSRQKQEGSVLTTVKCRREDPSDFFVLTAKDYTLDAPESRSAEELANGPYKRSYQQLYTSVKYNRGVAVKHQGRNAFDVKFDANHDRLGPIRKVERVIVEGPHVIVLSGEGNRDTFEDRQSLIEAWFANAQFRSLPPLTSPPS